MISSTLRTLTAVCDYLQVSLDSARKGTQLPRAVLARDVTMYVLRQYYQPRPSLSEIAIEFGRHNSSVITALARMEVRLHDEMVTGAIIVGREALGSTRAQWLAFVKQRELETARARVVELERELGLDVRAAPAAE